MQAAVPSLEAYLRVDSLTVEDIRALPHFTRLRHLQIGSRGAQPGSTVPSADEVCEMRHAMARLPELTRLDIGPQRMMVGREDDLASLMATSPKLTSLDLNAAYVDLPRLSSPSSRLDGGHTRTSSSTSAGTPDASPRRACSQLVSLAIYAHASERPRSSVIATFASSEVLPRLEKLALTPEHPATSTTARGDQQQQQQVGIHAHAAQVQEDTWVDWWWWSKGDSKSTDPTFRSELAVARRKPVAAPLPVPPATRSRAQPQHEEVTLRALDDLLAGTAAATANNVPSTRPEVHLYSGGAA